MGDLFNELVWDICERDRQMHMSTACKRCPAECSTTYGPGVRGCYFYASTTLFGLLRRLRMPSEGMSLAGRSARPMSGTENSKAHCFAAAWTAALDHLIAEGKTK